MVVVSVCVVPSLDPVVAPTGLEIGVIGVLPLDARRSVQLVARFEETTPFDASIAPTRQEAVDRLRGAGRELPTDAVLFLAGRGRFEVPYVTAVRLSSGTGCGASG